MHLLKGVTSRIEKRLLLWKRLSVRSCSQPPSIAMTLVLPYFHATNHRACGNIIPEQCCQLEEASMLILSLSCTLESQGSVFMRPLFTSNDRLCDPYIYGNFFFLSGLLRAVTLNRKANNNI